MQENHEMYTVDTVKTSLSPFNDKKWISREGDVFTSYSFGHHKIVEEELMDCLTDLANSNQLLFMIVNESFEYLICMLMYIYIAQ